MFVWHLTSSDSFEAKCALLSVKVMDISYLYFCLHYVQLLTVDLFSQNKQAGKNLHIIIPAQFLSSNCNPFALIFNSLDNEKSRQRFRRPQQ